MFVKIVIFLLFLLVGIVEKVFKINFIVVGLVLYIFDRIFVLLAVFFYLVWLCVNLRFWKV